MDTKRGQTLIEIVVAVGVVILLVMGVIVGSTTSVKGSEFSTYKSRSLKYAQEAMEVVRSMRDESWSSVAAKSGLWCLDGTGTWSQAQGTSCTINIDNFFTRSVTFTWDGGNNRMKVDVTVAWTDSGGTHTTTLTTYFTQWR